MMMIIRESKVVRPTN